MTNPLGWQHFCFTLLAAYIVDTPESTLIAGVSSKTSSVTMAMYKQFGDSFWHEPRTALTTLAQLHAIKGTVNPWELDAYLKAALKCCLNGVHRPFWADWTLSDPSVFLTPELLHYWYKGFWDHDAKWCINTVGAAEIDFHFSILHSHTGLWHFHEGISSLKQVTGQEHREMQQQIIGIIADAVPLKFFIAVRALMDFCYLSQSMEIDDEMCLKMEAVLSEFHLHKNAIIAASARRGKGKNSRINNWHIPKLEFLQSTVPNIQANGVAIQWSTDGTKRAHIEVIKNSSNFSNNQNYESQICCHLDCDIHCSYFWNQPQKQW
ncbi:hypothetical protein HYPSUDRAFT_64392 [Hypholoma sublateritium FD-334 SS-4]|uniref:Uncharacterized protein n=1 Tax=Hypholoma sublateritium (strain FD-334 SS-4) TaxID=945553 RepID=A0A0D2P467_HYPSF|nr:hypothetical protein HYPSUDRAFT_64392 [Hypholoma sublateritium FD-334 SS-4]